MTNNQKLLHARMIHLANGDVLEDKDCCINGNFLVVSADAPDVLPTWYNLSEITALQEVALPQPKPQTPVRFF